MRVGARRQLSILLLAGVASTSCTHSRRPPAGASPLSSRERSVVAADGVVITATQWDETMIELSAAQAPGPDRAALRERLQARYGAAGLAFTVVIELADRPLDADVLAEPTAWWFRSGDVPASRVELIAIDRYPTGDGRAHLRLGFDVQFAPRSDIGTTLRVGSKAAVSRRAELGAGVARRGVRLRW